MYLFKIVLLLPLLAILIPLAQATAAETAQQEPQKEWKISVGTGLIVAPAFAGARNYSLLAVPDIRVAYKDRFFANMKDGIGYALVHDSGWRIGPMLSYTFSRLENKSGSVFRIAGSSTNDLLGMGDVPGTVSLGGFVEYSLKPFKGRLHLHKGVTGHEGFVAEAGVSYGGAVTYNGPPLIYSFGPHIKFGDQKFMNSYWGISPEQSQGTGLEQYHADAGIVTYGVDAFAMMPVTRSVSVSAFVGVDRLASPAANSPLVRFRGSENQAMGGVFVSYGF